MISLVLFFFFWKLETSKLETSKLETSSHYVPFHEIERVCEKVISRGSHRGESRALATIVKYEASRKKISGKVHYYLHSKNKKTGCYGLWQQHPSHGKPSKTLLGQARWAWEYAKRRYGCACKALNFRKRRGYW